MRCFCARGRVGGGGGARGCRGGVLGVRMGLVMERLSARESRFGGECCRSCALGVVVGWVRGSVGVCVFCGIWFCCRCLCRFVKTCVGSLGALVNDSFVACLLIVWLEILILTPQNSCFFCVCVTCAHRGLASCRDSGAECCCSRRRSASSSALCPPHVLDAAPRP